MDSGLRNLIPLYLHTGSPVRALQTATMGWSCLFSCTNRGRRLEQGGSYTSWMIRCKIILLLVTAATGPLFAQQPAVKSDPLAPLRFFVGVWRGEQNGEPGHGASDRTYSFVLKDRFLQVKNTSTYPPQEKNRAGEIHQDMGMIGYDKARKKFVFRQFHVEGFVNTYVQEESSDTKKIVFVSEAIENISPGWRARETYLILNDNEFIERFELAEPGKDFALYAEARLKRAPPH
jgi:hypothetical protein